MSEPQEQEPQRIGGLRLVDLKAARARGEQAVPDGMAVRDARKAVRALASEKGGTVCPVCEAKATVYPRSLGRGPVLCLLWLYQASRRGSVDVDVQATAPPPVLKAREFDKLSLFGLARQGPTGLWGLSPAGVRFCEGNAAVPETLFVWRGEVSGASDAYRTLTDLADGSEAVAVIVRRFRAGHRVDTE